MTSARSLPGHPNFLRIFGDTGGVKRLRQGPRRGPILVAPTLLISALFASSAALAGDPKADAANTARAVGNAARTVAHAADQGAGAPSDEAPDAAGQGPFDRARPGVVGLV